MVYYTNFVLTEKNTKFYRIAYTFMDVLGEVGGLIEGANWYHRMSRKLDGHHVLWLHCNLWMQALM